MEDQPEESTFTECLLKPKEEVLDDIEITIKSECYDEKDLVIPKEEPSITNTSPYLAAEDCNDQKCNIKLLMPLKTEPSEENIQLQQQEFPANTEKILTKYVSTRPTTIEIKVEPIAETSVPTGCIETLGTPLPKKCLQTHYDTATVYPYSCNVCDYKCKYKSFLALHIRTHTGEKPFSCNLCQRVFTQKSHLNFHMKIHTGEKHYACHLCQKKFTNKSNLTDHTRTHTGEKPYTCNVCQIRCAQKNHLTAHMKTHTGERPFSCDICQVKFTLKHHLTDHMRIHTGEKPYSCNLCQLKFTRKYLLTTHNMRTHGTIKPA